MPSTMVTVDGLPVPVDVAGPDKGSVVGVLGAAPPAPSAYEAVCQRLHTASLRTVVIGPDPRLTAKSVIGILDSLDVKWALLVGDRIGGELAWELAATRLDRFIGLVVIDCGHPSVAGLTGEGRAANVPPPGAPPPPGDPRAQPRPAGGDEHDPPGQHPRRAGGCEGQPALRVRRLPV